MSEALLHYLKDHDVPCPGCGYNLREAREPECPECGRTIRLLVVREGPSLVPWGLLLIGVALMGGRGLEAWVHLLHPDFSLELMQQHWTQVLRLAIHLAGPIATIMVLLARRPLTRQVSMPMQWIIGIGALLTGLLTPLLWLVR